MTQFIPIAQHTAFDFANSMTQSLGRGRQQALSLYKEWCLQGFCEGKAPCFANAPRLREQMLAKIKLPHIEPKKIIQEGETIKFTLPVEGDFETESVILPMKSGWTLCLSSQVGCRMGCRFCETGRMGLLRQLTTEEIVRQLACALHWFKKPIRNIVFMGMGEPMDNLEAVIPSIRIFNDENGFGLGARHLTVSTSGHLEGLRYFTQALRPFVNLAVSVIASNDALRTKLMPVNRRWNMSELYDSMLEYNKTTQREILIEYVLLKDLNDKTEHALELAKYLRGLQVKVNLIPYNRQSEAPPIQSEQLTPSDFYPSETETCESFAQTLRSQGYRTLLRKRKGHDIMAACGQLGNKDWKKKREENPLRIIEST